MRATIIGALAVGMFLHCSGQDVRSSVPANSVRFTTVETKHISLKPGASHGKIKEGQRVILSVDVDTKPEMHIYAPGVEGFIPLELNIVKSPTFVVSTTIYPPSRRILLTAIGEIADVYQGTITIASDVTFGARREIIKHLNSDGTLEIQGTLRYQACDNKLCYIPVTVPVKWNFKVSH